MTKGWKLYLQRLARLKGMCEDNRAYLAACEAKSDAIRLYKQTIDWALENDYPDLDFLKKEFSKSESDGVYVCKHFDGEILNKHQVYVFHNCTGTIRVGLNFAKKIIPMCYFANGCNMTILGIEGERWLPDRVPLYIFGDNEIDAKNSNTIEVRIFKHRKKGGRR